ncbi:MAG: hypothetical protein U5K81_10250 [Trueperaceae bacterium]|nr:hypothetical protein [Trueperaceae bacterium]
MARLVDVVVLADRDPQVADAARFHLFGQRLPQFRVVEDLPFAGVELVKVHVVGSERLQRGVELLEDLVRGPELVALEVAQVAVPEFGGDVPVLASALDRLADQAFGDVVAVAFRGVEEVDAEFAGAVQDVSHLGHLVVAAPFAPELPGADSDDGDGQSGRAQTSVLHGGLLFPGRAMMGSDSRPRVVRPG